MKKNELNNITIGNCGEHYVAAELERRNFSVAVVGNNCPDYDISAVNNETHKTVLIQVKTTKGNKTKWLVGKNQTNEENLFYIFVNLNGIDEDVKPEYYIVPSDIVVNRKNQNHIKFEKEQKKRFKKQGYTNDEIQEKQKINTMREFRLKDDEIEIYKDNWNLLKDVTKKEMEKNYE